MKLSIKPIEVFSASLAIFSPLAALLLIDRGLEMGDEGYYLNFLRYPEAYDMATFFAIYYQPLMWFANGDIALVRAMNLLVLYGSALVFAFVLLRAFLFNRLSQTQIFVTSLAIAGSVVLYLSTWLPTPSYNSLNLLGLIWFGIGAIAVTAAKNSLWRTSGLVALGVGIGLSGAAKPTTGIALLVIVGILLFRRKLKPLELLGSGLATLLVIAPIIFFFGGLQQFFENLLRAWTAVSILEGGQLDFLSWERFAVRPDPLGVTVILSLFALLVLPEFFSEESRVLSLMMKFAAFGALTLFCTMNQFWEVSSSFIELAPAVPALALIWVSWKNRWQFAQLSSEAKVVIVVLSALPIAYVIGTNGNYLKGSGAASIFWIGALGLLILLVSPNVRHKNYYSVSLSAFVVIVMAFSIHLPFRQDLSIFEQEKVIGSGLSLRNIKVSSERLDAIRSLEDGLLVANPSPRLVIVDITGVMPTVVTLLEGFQPGLPWIMSNYSGATDLSRYSFSSVDFDDLQIVSVLHVGDIKSAENREALLAIGLNWGVTSSTYVERRAFSGLLPGPIDAQALDLRISVLALETRD
jgi:hypothetical protein